MSFSFQQAKDIVLRATYETLVHHAEFESFGAEDVHKRLEQDFSPGFVRRILTALGSDGLVTPEQYDESSPLHYTVSDQGFEYVESMPTLRQLLSGDLQDQAHLEVPASDRVVTLNHNQRVEVEQPLSAVVELVEAENSIGGEDGLRELTLGRLKAGLELIRAGIFSLKSIELTLIIGLKLLAEKYGDLAIGIAAAKLLDMLLKQYGIG